MDPALNPYVPGAGTRPPLLAGRDDLVSAAVLALRRAKNGLHGKSFIAVGLRGVGKTVVLNRVHELAEDDSFHVIYMEAHDEASLAKLIVPQLRSVLIKLSRSAAVADIGTRALKVLRNFAKAINVRMGDIEVGLDLEAEAGVADSGDLTNDLPEIFQVIGQVAQKQKTAIAIIIDEMQYLSSEEMVRRAAVRFSTCRSAQPAGHGTGDHGSSGGARCRGHQGSDRGTLRCHAGLPLLPSGMGIRLMEHRWR